MPTPYEILGLSPNASEKDVKSAYRKLAKEFHPDVNKDPGAETKFKEISQAYEDILNFDWVIDIGGSDDTDVGSFATWASAKTLQMFGRNYDGSGNENDHHGTRYWHGTTDNQFNRPKLFITAIA